jgi:trk system potassium uptake protein TrkH
MEAVTIAFSTISTGGFSVKNSSIASYNNPYTDWIIILFMVLGSINFLLYFYWIRGRFQRIQDSEFSVFLIIIIFTSLFVTWELWGIQLNPMDEPSDPLSFGNALRYGTFQIVSAISSTGFYSANFDVWPFSIQTTMLILMFVGGMAGSTAGGIKIVRQLIFFRILANKIETLFRPDAVRTFRIGTRPIGEQIAITVLCFILIVVLFATIGTFLLVLDGADPETSLTTIACMINNVGFSFRMGGPEHSFCFLSNFGKIISCIWMVAGRIEYFALLIAFAPAFWKKH